VGKKGHVLEKYTTEEQRTFLHFCGQNDSMQRIFINKRFPLMVGSVRRVKQTTTGSRNSLKDVRKSQMMKRRCGSG
jgi:hypothetical protein